jgi:hypothetical protein
MDTEIFNVIRDNIKNGNINEAETKLLELENQAKALAANKESAVGEIKKLKAYKHAVNEKFELGTDMSLDDSLNKIGERLGTYKQSVTSMKETTDGKNTELMQLQSIVADTQSELKDMKTLYENERMETKTSKIKDTFRTALSENGITSVDKQNLAIKSSLLELQTVEDMTDFAKTFASTHAYLTDTQHVKGTDTQPSKTLVVPTSLKDCKTAEERIAYHQQDIDNNSK